MTHRRAEIALSPGEVGALLDEARVVTCATLGPRGWPHLVPLWFVVRDGEVWAWTFGRSQKVRNLERDPRATLQVEAGVDYQELRGVVLECEAVVHRDHATIAGVGLDVLRRYADPDPHPEAVAFVERQARKRVALQFVERRRASWDHRKLAGAY